MHIEPKRDVTIVRMRIDGVLHTVYRLPKTVYSAIVSRIKNLSRLDMAEKRRPQDGRIETGRGTIEDPIEMVYEEFNEIAVQLAVGITFGTILRNILRQDPDIIMVSLAFSFRQPWWAWCPSAW